MGFVNLVAQDWDTLATPEGAEALVNTFVETDTLVLPRKKPIEVTIKIIKEAVGLPDKRITKLEKNYGFAEEIQKKESMH